jgi:pilus assembly protein CpaE
VLSEKRARQQEARGGKAGITVFLQAKGGCGATTLAVNVAQMLVKKHSTKVALVDLDLQFGSTALQLDMNPRDTVLRALQDPQRVDTVFLNALMARHESGLDVLASPVNVVPPDAVTQEGVSRVLDVVAEEYDFVIVDLSRELSAWEQVVLKMSDPVVLVLQNDLAILRDAKLLLDKLPSLGVPHDRVEVVINRAGAKDEHISESQLETLLKDMRVHRVRNDYETAATARDAGIPVLEVAKRSPMTKDIAALTDYLFKVHQGESQHKAGVFKRLFGQH